MVSIQIPKRSSLCKELEAQGAGELHGIYSFSTLDTADMSDGGDTKEPSPRVQTREFQEQPSSLSESSPLSGGVQEQSKKVRIGSFAEELPEVADNKQVLACSNETHNKQVLACSNETLQPKRQERRKSFAEGLAEVADSAAHELAEAIEGLAEIGQSVVQDPDDESDDDDEEDSVKVVRFADPPKPERRKSLAEGLAEVADELAGATDNAVHEIVGFAGKATQGLGEAIEGLAEYGQSVVSAPEHELDGKTEEDTRQVISSSNETPHPPKQERRKSFAEGLVEVTHTASHKFTEAIEGLAELGQSAVQGSDESDDDDDVKVVRFADESPKSERRKSLAEGLANITDTAAQELAGAIEGLASFGQSVIQTTDNQSDDDDDDVRLVRSADQERSPPTMGQQASLVRFADEERSAPTMDRQASLVRFADEERSAPTMDRQASLRETSLADDLVEAVDEAVHEFADFAGEASHGLREAIEGLAESGRSANNESDSNEEETKKSKNSYFSPTTSEDDKVSQVASKQMQRRKSLAESIAETAEIAVNDIVGLAGEASHGLREAIEGLAEFSHSVVIGSDDEETKDENEGVEQKTEATEGKGQSEPGVRVGSSSDSESGNRRVKQVRILGSDESQGLEDPSDVSQGLGEEPPITFRRASSRKRQSLAQSSASSSPNDGIDMQPLQRMQAAVRGAFIASGIIVSGAKLLRETRRPFRQLILDDTCPLELAISPNGEQPELSVSERCQLISYVTASCEAIAKKLSTDEGQLWDAFVRSDSMLKGVLHVQSDEITHMLRSCFGESDRIGAWLEDISVVADENQEIDFADLLDWYTHAQQVERLWSFWSVARASLGSSVARMGEEVASELQARCAKMPPRDLIQASMAYRRSFMLTNCWQCEHRVQNILWNGETVSPDMESRPPPSPMHSLLTILRAINAELNPTERVLWEIIGSKGKFFGASYTKQDLLAGISELLVYTLERELATPSQEFEELQNLRSECQRRSIDSLFSNGTNGEEHITVSIVEIIEWWWDMPEEYRIAAGLSVPEILLHRSAHRQPEEMFKDKLRAAVTNQSVAQTALRGHVRAYAQLKALSAKCTMQAVQTFIAEAEDEMDL